MDVGLLSLVAALAQSPQAASEAASQAASQAAAPAAVQPPRKSTLAASERVPQPTFAKSTNPPSRTPAGAGGRRIDYIPAERFAEARTRVTNSRSVGASVFVAPDQQTAYIVVRRTVASEVEEHSRWDDLVIVQGGRGAIDLGRGATKGARFVAPGELRGGELLRPGRVELRPGDVVRVPAGMPHSFVPLSQEPWELLLIKVRRPDKPLKRDPTTVAAGQKEAP
jgi:mannose-6-phosphate isomerase-like protein (cupin superfamily)